MKTLAAFLAGIICGAVFIMVVACLFVGGDDR